MSAAADDLDAILREAAEEARREGRDGSLAVIDRAQRPAAARLVLVVGPPGSGKSALVDALLGATVGSGGPGRPTAAPVAVHWAAEASARVSWRPEPGAAAPPPLEPLAVGDAGAVAAGASGGRSPAAVGVALPRALLADGVVVVDTPGLPDGLEAAWAGRVLALAARADTAVYVVDVSAGLTAGDVAVIRRLADVSGEVLVALTHTDMHRDWRRVLARVHVRLRDEGLPVPVLPLAAPLRRHALRVEDLAAVRESGYPRLSALLRQGVVARARRDRARARILAVGAALGRTDEAVGAGPGPGLSGRRDAPSTPVAGADDLLRHDLDELARQAAARLHAGPSPAWSLLESWLHPRVAEALLAHAARVRADEGAELEGGLGAARPLQPDLRWAAGLPLALAGDADPLLELLALPEPLAVPAAAVRVLRTRRAGRPVLPSALERVRGESEREVRRHLDECHRAAVADAAQWAVRRRELLDEVDRAARIARAVTPAGAESRPGEGREPGLERALRWLLDETGRERGA